MPDRAVTKISSCQVNTTSRWGIKQLGIFFGSFFLLFSSEIWVGGWGGGQVHSSRGGPLAPGPPHLMTALDARTNANESMGEAFNLGKPAQHKAVTKTSRCQLNTRRRYKEAQEVGGHATEDKKQIQTSNTSINHPRSVQMKFYSCLYSL